MTLVSQKERDVFYADIASVPLSLCVSGYKKLSQDVTLHCIVDLTLAVKYTASTDSMTTQVEINSTPSSLFQSEDVMLRLHFQSVQDKTIYTHNQHCLPLSYTYKDNNKDSPRSTDR